MTPFEIISLTIALVGTIAACASAIAAFVAKTEVKKLTSELHDIKLRADTNSGIMVGQFQGDIYEKK